METEKKKRTGLPSDTEKAAEPKDTRPLFTERTGCQEKEKSA